MNLCLILYYHFVIFKFNVVTIFRGCVGFITWKLFSTMVFFVDGFVIKAPKKLQKKAVEKIVKVL